MIRRIVVISVVVASIATACTAQKPGPTSPTSTLGLSGSSQPDCVTLPAGVTGISWGADGSTLAVLMDFSAPAGGYSNVDLVSWPSPTVRQQYRPGYPLGPTVPAYDGSSLYWFGRHNDVNGFWRLSASGDSTLIGSAPDEPVDMAVATSQGFVWSSFSDIQSLTLAVRKMDRAGPTQTIVPSRLPVLQTWIDGQGQWIVLSSKTDSGGQLFEVLHGVDVLTVRSPVVARLVGMSPDRTAVIYRPESDLKDHGTSIELHRVALVGGADNIVRVPLPFGLGASPVVLSSTGVLAYGDQAGFSHRLCFAVPDLVQGK